MLLHVDIGEEVYNITKALLVQFRTSEIFGKDALQSVILLLDKAHGLIDLDSDFRGVGIGRDNFPASLLRYPENALAGVLVLILLHSIAFCNEFLITLLESVGDIFQKNKTENNMLILGSIHAAP